MKKEARIITTDAEIEAAIAQANVREDFRPKVAAVVYREQSDMVVVTLTSGIELAVPRRLLQGLEGATPAQLTDVKIVSAQSGLYWPQLNVDHYVPGMIEGVFGNRRWMSAIGKRGGASRSAAKAAAVRENGRKGGRPPKKRAAA